MNDTQLKNKEVTVTLYTGIEKAHDDAWTAGIFEKYTNSKNPDELTRTIHSITYNDPFL